MGQQEVYEFLMNNNKSWYTSKQISSSLNISIGSITACLKKLRKTDSVKYEETGNRNEFRYRYKTDEPVKRSSKKKAKTVKSKK